jgi:hypothetical protein
MSAAFTLAPSGPPAPCGFPGCALESYHEGDHLLAQKTSPPQQHARHFICCECRTPMVEYGDHVPGAADLCDSQQCLLAHARREINLQPLRCSCPQRPYGHDVSIHTKLRRESYFVGERRFTWPWSLVLADRLEPSTETEAVREQ